MELQELLEIFNKGEVIDNPQVLIEMRKYIAENRRLLFEMNHKWHENEEEITELFSKIIGRPVGKNVRICTPFFTDFNMAITSSVSSFVRVGISIS